MIDDGVKQQLKNLDERLERVEQILPSLATRQDLTSLATRDEIALLATRDEIALLATKDEIALLATKAELQAAVAALATKDELAAAVATLATKDELAAAVALLATKAELREESEKTRRHMDVIAEHLTAQMALIYESHTRHTERLDEHGGRLQALELKHDGLDQRVQALERTRTRRPS